MEGDNRVQVFARARPLVAQEGRGWQFLEVDDVNNSVLVDSGKSDASPGGGLEPCGSDTGGRAFNFDGVFSAASTQHGVFTQVGLPVLQACLQGLNGTILAYGQTGSGKTHSLLNQSSNSQELGLLPRLVASLFLQISQDAENVYDIEAAAVQVYNEQVDDLLHPDRDSGMGFNLGVKDGGLIPQLYWVKCNRPEALLEAFAKARSNLVYAETRMNKASSRSHAVFQVKITRRSAGDEGKGGRVECTRSRLTVIDLAGSERVKKSGAEGAQLKEALAINKSLLVFGNVVSALAAKQRHVPFRESKLTRILDGSIGGNSRTSLLVCVSLAAENAAETYSALEFASRAMRVEVDARVNRAYLDGSDIIEDPRLQLEDMMDSSLREENANLRKSLSTERRRADEALALQQAAEKRIQELEDELAVSRRGERELLRSSQALEVKVEEWKEVAEARAEELEAQAAEVQSCLRERDEALERARRAEANLEEEKEEMEKIMEEVDESAVRDMEKQKEADDLMVSERQRASEDIRLAKAEAEEWKARAEQLEEDLAELQHLHRCAGEHSENDSPDRRLPLQPLRQNRHSTATRRAFSADAKRSRHGKQRQWPSDEDNIENSLTAGY
mmetsp:Transcript_82745/g.146108  ORF Transcript_82745/g.146108 Transcript_82745/m.146108 type:complete len:618 (-) Transcript_82745:59-1912(-)